MKEEYVVKKRFKLPKYTDDLSDDLYISQTFTQQKLFKKSSFLRAIRTLTIPVFYCLYENEKLVMILPLMYSKKKSFFYGHSSVFGLPKKSFIFFENDKSKILKYLRLILDFVKTKTLVLNNIPKDSVISELLLTNTFNVNIEVKSVEEVKINLQKFSSFEEYIDTLSYNMKQNVRKVQNRLKADNRKTEFLYLSSLDKEQVKKYKKQIFEAYCKRRLERYKISSNIFERFCAKRFDFYFRTLCYNPSIRIGIFKIDDEIASFFIGLYDEKKKTLMLRKTAVNEKFPRYSAGSVLFIKAIDLFIQNKEVDVLDLLIGTEPYKLRLGGEIYYTNDFIITKK